MAAYPALLLSFAIPAGPGYLGNLEVAGLAGAAGGLGLATAVAAGAIVLYHAITAGNALVFGLLSFLLVGGPAPRARGRPAPDRGLPLRLHLLGRRRADRDRGGAWAAAPRIRGRVLRADRRPVPLLPGPDRRRASRARSSRSCRAGFRSARPCRWRATSLLMPLYAWRFRGVDAIVGCNQPSAWIAWWAARLMDVPYVVYLNQPNRLVYPRNIDRETGWVANADYRLLAAIVLRATRFVAWADRRSIQEADQLLVNGDYIGDIIRRTYRREAIDCPAGCHVASSGFPLPDRSAFLGRPDDQRLPDPPAVRPADQPPLPAEAFRPHHPGDGRGAQAPPARPARDPGPGHGAHRRR